MTAIETKRHYVKFLTVPIYLRGGDKLYQQNTM